MDFNFTRLRLPLLAALVTCGAAAPARAATLNVPAQYGTIQSAITAAQPGDVVLLADGTYTGTGNVNLDFGGKSITVTSQNGAAKTIIDCQGQASTVGVVFHSGEDPAAKFQGVTVQNGRGNFPSRYRGGDVTVISSSPTITGCVFAGSNITALNSDATSHPRINNCTFANNSTSGFGGGLNAASQVTVTGCTFTGNTADDAGGGAFIAAASGVGSTVSGCTFTGNIAGTDGGAGAYSIGGSTFTDCVFVGNVTGSNTASGFYGAATLTNCTFTGNVNPLGAAVDISVGSITNCILFGDGGTELTRTGTGTTSYCDIQGGYAGTGNISIDPQFVRSPNLNSTPPDYGDLHLRTNSPLVRAGTTAGAPLTTLDGAVRPTPPSIGAFEVGPALLPAVADSYVLSSAPAQNFGSTPTLTIGGFLGAAYLQFDLSSLASLSPGSSVKLRLNASRPLAGTSSLVVSAASGFNEPGLTFNSRPAIGLPQGFVNVTGGQGNAPYDVDVTSYVKAQQALGITQVSLALTQFAPGLPVSIDSKENSAGDGPQLVVTY